MSRVSKFVSDDHVSARVPAPRRSRVSQVVTRLDTGDPEVTPVTRVVTTGVREAQERGSKVKEFKVEETKMKESRATMSGTEGLSNLRKYNNILVRFIEKARVLSEAEEISKSYPKSL